MKVKVFLGVIGILYLVCRGSVCANEMRSESKGKMVGFIEIWAQDVSYLQNEIDNLKAECGRK